MDGENLGDEEADELRRQFDDCSGQLVFDHGDPNLERWRSFIRVVPVELVRILEEDARIATVTALDVEADGRGRFETDFRAGIGSIGTAKREFDIPNRDVYHAFFRLHEDYQGQGHAKVYLRNWVRVYRHHWNIATIRLDAALDGGGYAWLRYGFVPYPESWDVLRGILKRELLAIREELEDFVFQIAYGRLDSPDPNKSRMIADLDYPIENTTLGRYLLRGKNWSGMLDLTDEGVLNRFLRYVGE